MYVITQRRKKDISKKLSRKSLIPNIVSYAHLLEIGSCMPYRMFPKNPHMNKENKKRKS